MYGLLKLDLPVWSSGIEIADRQRALIQRGREHDVYAASAEEGDEAASVALERGGGLQHLGSRLRHAQLVETPRQRLNQLRAGRASRHVAASANAGGDARAPQRHERRKEGVSTPVRGRGLDDFMA